MKYHPFIGWTHTYSFLNNDKKTTFDGNTIHCFFRTRTQSSPNQTQEEEDVNEVSSKDKDNRKNEY